MENININDNAESNNFKRFIQCPLCPNIPRIGLSIDEQSHERIIFGECDLDIQVF